MNKIDCIISHLIELYQVNEKDADKINSNIAEYEKAFSDYERQDILKAIDDYWRFKNDKTRPRLAQILAMMNSGNEPAEQKKVTAYEYAKLSDKELLWQQGPAMFFYTRDCKTMASERVHALVYYSRAVDEILGFNVEVLPNAGKMSFAQKVCIAQRNAWFDNITDVVEQIVEADKKGNGHIINMQFSNMLPTMAWR